MRNTSPQFFGIFLRSFATFALATCGACAQTAGGGGGAADTATTGGDTATGADGTKAETATGTGDSAGKPDTSSVGAEKSVIDIQKASAACPTPNPQSYGEMPGVTIRNVVVSSPGRDEGTSTPKTLIGMFVQQKGGGQFSGIYITGKKSGELGQAKPGDVLTITGDVKDFYCFTQMYANFVTIESQGKELPAAVTVTTEDLGDKAGAAKTEPYEGVLVEFHDVVIGEEALGNDGKAHGDVYIGKDETDKAVRLGNDFYGVYLSEKTKGADGKDVFTPKYPKGTKLGTLRGVVEYSFDTYRVVISEDPTGVVKPKQ